MGLLPYKSLSKLAEQGRSGQMLAEQGRWPCATFTTLGLPLYLGQLIDLWLAATALQVWLMLSSVTPAKATAPP